MIRLMVLAAVLLLLGSCAVSPPLPVAEPVAAPTQATPRLDLLAAVRAAAVDAGDVIHVEPLRDPAVEDLRLAAEAAEARGDIVAATAALESALQITPDDPQLMQEFAELLLAQDRLGDAEELAGRSYDNGPKLGGLCRRNWTTVQLARLQRGDPEGAARAAQQVSRCIVEPSLRM